MQKKNRNNLALNGGMPVCKKLDPFNTIGKQEINAVTKVLKSGKLSGFFAKKDNGFLGGEKVIEFEKKICNYFNVKYAIAVNSWTSGLQTAVGAIDIQPGDEVIVTPWTMCATVSSIVSWLGIPVFADIDRDTLNISVKSIKKVLSKRTKAIMLADIHGLSADMDEIKKIAEKHNLKIICDTAQSPGAKYKGAFAGTLGDIGGFSLNYHKHIHTGEGGVLVTNDDYLANRCRLIRNHAECIVTDKSNLSNMIGSNYRMGEIEAAIGIEQLKKLNKIIKNRQKIAKVIIDIVEDFNFISIPKVPKECTHVYYVLPIIYDESLTGISRKKFVNALKAEGLGDIVFEGYSNIHLLPMFQKKIAFGKEGIPWKSNFYKKEIDYKKGICPVAEDLHDNKFVCFCCCMLDGSEKDLKKLKKIFLKVLSNISEIK